MEKIISFCNTNNICTNLEKRWYENIFTFLYTNRMRKYEKTLTSLYCMYEQLSTEISEAIDYYNTHEVPKIAPYTNERFTIEMPQIDFSNLETAYCQISDALEYFHSNAIWKEIFNIRTYILYNVKKDFILNSIKNLPSNKNVVIIKSCYIPKIEIQESFHRQCINFANTPDSSSLSIRVVNYAEWIAFCPYKNTFQDIEKIINDWAGNPLSATISYL